MLCDQKDKRKTIAAWTGGRQRKYTGTQIITNKGISANLTPKRAVRTKALSFILPARYSDGIHMGAAVTAENNINGSSRMKARVFTMTRSPVPSFLKDQEDSPSFLRLNSKILASLILSALAAIAVLTSEILVNDHLPS